MRLKKSVVKKPPRRKRNEAAFQADFVVLFRREAKKLKPEPLIFSVNNNAKGLVRGAINKAMGCLAGIPDLVVVYEGRVAFIEMKATGLSVSGLSSAQKACHRDLAKLGHSVLVLEEPSNLKRTSRVEIEKAVLPIVLETMEYLNII